MERPEKNEYAPAYQKYIDLVDTGDFIELLDKIPNQLFPFLAQLIKKRKIISMQ